MSQHDSGRRAKRVTAAEGTPSAEGEVPMPPLVTQQTIRCTVNGLKRTLVVDVRTTLVDALREQLELTGTHVGCEHGVCGACTILLDGVAVRSCLLFAVQADGRTITTVEGLGTPEKLHPLQEAFRKHHGLQCGFCTPGFLMSALALLSETPQPTDDDIRTALAGNLCRCTGYQGIVEAVRDAAARRAAVDPQPQASKPDETR